ncbi:MAG: hypothetical protein ACTSXZ_04040 [Alphaproteobacteria bacterium]
MRARFAILLCLIVSLVLSCGQKDGEEKAQYPPTYDQVKTLLMQLDVAMKERNNDGVIAVFSREARIQYSISGNNLTFTPMAFVREVGSGWQRASEYRYSPGLPEISSEGAVAKVSKTDVMHSAYMGNRTETTFENVYEIKLIDDKPKIIAMKVQATLFHHQRRRR